MFLRKFIILNKQGSKDAKGHVKLEVRSAKARLSLTVEGVEQSDDAVYKLYIVSNESNNFKELDLGMVEVDKRGRGKLDLGFNANSIATSQLDIADFNILILKREENFTKESEVILGGYIHKDDDTLSKIKGKNRVRARDLENTESESQEPQKSQLESEKIPEEQKKSPQPQEAQEKRQTIKSTVEKTEVKAEEPKAQDEKEQKEQELPKQQKIQEEIQEQEEVQIDTKIDNIEMELEQHEIEELENYMNDCKEYDELSKQKENSVKHYSNQIASYTLDILKFFKRVNPFKVEFEDYKWWRIDYEEMNTHRGFLPYSSYILNSNYQSKQGKYPTCQSQIKRHNHYLFGMVEKQGKITHYVYAIPGKYERKEHPYGGNTGFVTWLEDKNESGYWLSYIDAQTGNVVRPR